jgi:hypothetical protein
MILIPKNRDFIAPQSIPLSLGMMGLYKYEAVNKFSGKKRLLVDWHENAILDAGRNIMATSSNWAGAGSSCQVGTNSTPATKADTQLLGYVFGSNTVQAHTWGSQATPPYYSWDLTTYRFGVGDAEGNISEAGVGWSTASGPFLISRARVVDGSGNPTTAVVLADEFLDVSYELRYYPPLDDTLGTVTLDGLVYDTVTRASLVTSSNGNAGQTMGQRSLFPSDWQAYDGALGDITQAPSGAFAACDNSDQFNLAYNNNSYEIDMQCNCGTGGWNLGAGIRCIRIRTNAGDFQTSFTRQGGGGETIPKTASFTMAMVWRLGWVEAATLLPATGTYVVTGQAADLTYVP